MIFATLYLALLAIVAGAAAAPAPCTLRVDPSLSMEDPAFGQYRTIASARAAVRSAVEAATASDGDIIVTGGNMVAAQRLRDGENLVVCLTPGPHDVSIGPEHFTEADGIAVGAGRVVWRGLGNPRDPSVVTGGARVTGWAPTTLGGGQVYVAAVPVGFPAAPAAVVRQLWVGGVRSARVVIAAAPGSGPIPSKCTMDFNGGPDAWQCTAAAPICVGFVANVTWGHCVSPNCDSDFGSGSPSACPAPVPKCVGFVANHTWGHCVLSGVTNSSVIPAMRSWVSADKKTVGFLASSPIPAAWLINSTHSIEFTWPIVLKNWIAPRCTVASIIGNNITLASPCGAHLLTRTGDVSLPSPVFIEAAPAFPLAPGVFWHDRDEGKLYYCLARGQTAADLEADAWTAPQEVLMTFTNVTGHVWENLQFSHATWYQPNSGDGFVDSQTAVYSCTAGTPGCNMGTAGEPRGAVQVSGSSFVTFNNCTFIHLGSPYALSVMESSKHVTVTASSFMDLSGGFLKLGSVDGTRYGGSPNPNDWDSHFSITHNVASDQAVEYGGAAGFFGGFIFSADVSHNTVSDAGYSGFSVGWGWGDVFPPGYGNNTIAFNRIYNVMTKLKDGGGIYVNGATNGSYPSLMANNWVNNDEHVFAVYYLDNGASHWHVTNNVATNSTIAWAFFMTGGPGPKALAAQNNRLDHFWYESDAAPVNNCAKYNCVVDESTVYKIVPPAPLPAAAIAIMNAAGAQPAD